MITVLTGSQPRPSSEAVFFPFDPFNVPLMGGLKLHLVSGVKKGIVVGRGEPGAVDHYQLNYYGSTIEIDGKYQMWYLGGGGNDDHRNGKAPCWYFDGICYAVSEGGVHWEKPCLGVVEYNGSRDNNLVDLDCRTVVACTVIHDPQDPDPDRRFKMIFESHKYDSKMAVAYSADGLCWRESSQNPVLPYCIEPSGLIRIGDCYYVNGQSGAGDVGGRALCTHMSYDFEHRTSAYNVGLRRHNIPGRQPGRSPVDPAGVSGTQVHLGASLWDRGNTILGFYGIWNCPDQDHRHVYMDLGLVTTTDALTYHEPIPDFPIVWAASEGGDFPSLIQGQGWANTDDTTLYWFGGWRDGAVRLATWQRDRLGYVSVVGQTAVPLPHLITSPFRIHDGQAKVLLNADGISEHSKVTVSVTDEQFQPLDGFEAADCHPVGNGLRAPVTWKVRKAVPATGEPLRLRVNMEGLRAQDTKLYCAYVEEAGI